MEKDVPYIVYESEAARHERTVKRIMSGQTDHIHAGEEIRWADIQAKVV